jgi:hypothetical protein
VLDHLLGLTGGAASTGVALFVFGHIIATVVGGIALFRARAVPRLLAIASAVSQVLHFVALVILANQARCRQLPSDRPRLRRCRPELPSPGTPPNPSAQLVPRSPARVPASAEPTAAGV